MRTFLLAVSILGAMVIAAGAQTVTPERRAIQEIDRGTLVAPTPPGRDLSKLPGARPLDMPDPSNSQELPLPPLPMPPR